MMENYFHGIWDDVNYSPSEQRSCSAGDLVFVDQGGNAVSGPFTTKSDVNTVYAISSPDKSKPDVKWVSICKVGDLAHAPDLWDDGGVIDALKRWAGDDSERKSVCDGIHDVLIEYCANIRLTKNRRDFRRVLAEAMNDLGDAVMAAYDKHHGVKDGISEG